MSRIIAEQTGRRDIDRNPLEEELIQLGLEFFQVSRCDTEWVIGPAQHIPAAVMDNKRKFVSADNSGRGFGLSLNETGKAGQQVMLMAETEDRVNVDEHRDTDDGKSKEREQTEADVGKIFEMSEERPGANHEREQGDENEARGGHGEVPEEEKRQNKPGGQEDG